MISSLAMNVLLIGSLVCLVTLIGAKFIIKPIEGIPTDPNHPRYND